MDSRAGEPGAGSAKAERDGSVSTLGALWNHAEKAASEKTAVLEKGRRLNYREMGESIRRIQAGLVQRWRLEAGAIVAILAPNCAEFVISYFAVASAGGIVQPLDQRLTPEEIKAVMLDSGAGYLIVHRTLWPKFERIRAEIPALEGVVGIDFAPAGGELFDDWLARACEDLPRPNVNTRDVAEIMYTSGTTGEAKGVLRSHANVWAAASNAIRGFGYRSSDVIGIVMPLSHSSGLSSQMMPLLQLGGTLLLLDGFEVDGLIAAIRDQRVTCMRAVPAMMRMLLASADFTAHALPSLRLFVNSSAPIDTETYRALKHRFPKIQVMNSYGLTEASTCTVLPDSMSLTHPESIGLPIQGVEMSVRDEQGWTVANQREGEIYVRGEHVFLGYHNRPEATRRALSDGWLRTGDFGHCDSDGRYYLHGRKDDFINCGGRKFAPLEVENCILELPEVLEVAVVGVPHRFLGQVAKAFVVGSGKNGVNNRRVIQHCARQLPSHKVPFSVVFVSELPKSGTGKVLHRKLKETVDGSTEMHADELRH
jgi:long-chain acyl-CoA synthetase